MMMLINILLLFAYVLVYGENTTCDLRIIDSNCDDDYIHFNISISKECENSMDIYYSYATDIDSERIYSITITDCRNCYFDLTIKTVHDAWDYTLTLESSESNPCCSTCKAHCGGNASRLLWIITGSLSCVFILSGIILCIVRCYRVQHHMKSEQKAVINS